MELASKAPNHRLSLLLFIMLNRGREQITPHERWSSDPGHRYTDHCLSHPTTLPSDGKNIAGEVLTIKKIRQEGSRYNFLFEEYEGKTFYAFSEIVPSVRWIDEVGSKVKVDFRMSEDNEIPIKDIAEVK